MVTRNAIEVAGGGLPPVKLTRLQEEPVETTRRHIASAFVPFVSSVVNSRPCVLHWQPHYMRARK